MRALTGCWTSRSLGRSCVTLCLKGNMVESIIKVDRKKAFIRWLPVWAVLLILLAFTLYTKSLDDPTCGSLVGFNVLFLNMVLISYVLPGFFFMASLVIAVVGYKELRYGYSPPLDSVAFIREKSAKTGTWVKAKGVFGLLLPIFCMYVIYFGNRAYIEVTKGATYPEVIQTIESECDSQT
jgi:vacuolar-type H+-ATPase subunit I/STV1